MPRAKTGSPKSAYDYEQEGKEQQQEEDEFKSQEAEDRDVRANMKALRLLDQSKVRSTEEVERNYNSNMEALKLLDEVTTDESAKPRHSVATVMPGVDLSPKQYSDQDEYEEGDDILAQDDIKRYKRAEYIAREYHSKNKALNLLDESFGHTVQKSHKSNKQTVTTSTRKPSKVDPDLAVPKLAKHIARDRQSKKKALKLLDKKCGGEGFKSSQHSKTAQSTSHRAPTNAKPQATTAPTSSRPQATAAPTNSKPQATTPDRNMGPRPNGSQEVLTLSPRSANSSDLDLSPKQYTGREDVHEGSNDTHLPKRAENIAREYHSKKKAHQLFEDSFGGEAKDKYKKLEDMATSTRQKKTGAQDLSNADTVAALKGEYDHKLQRVAEERALKMVNSASLVRQTNIV